MLPDLRTCPHVCSPFGSEVIEGQGLSDGSDSSQMLRPKWSVSGRGPATPHISTELGRFLERRRRLSSPVAAVLGRQDQPDSARGLRLPQICQAHKSRPRL